MHPASAAIDKRLGQSGGSNARLTGVGFGHQEHHNALLGGEARDVDVLALLVLQRQRREAIAQIYLRELRHVLLCWDDLRCRISSWRL